MSKYTYTVTELQNAVNTSKSKAECIKKLGLNISGNAYKVFDKRVKDNNIDITHFSGQGWAKGKRGEYKPRIPLKDILAGKHPYYQSYKLKNRLLREKILERKCYGCKNVEWLNKPIPLELEHKDGDSMNHKLNNLTLLCPNCHALTSTHAGKNKKVHRKRSHK